MAHRSSTYTLEKARLIARGAEAHIYLIEDWHGFRAVAKVRVSKPYRVRELDTIIRARRTKLEAYFLYKVKRYGVPTPTVLHIDLHNATIIMEYVEGILLREHLLRTPDEDAVEQLGSLAALLHTHSIVHGDLTTSNAIFSDEQVVLFDFGLAKSAVTVEDFGVDVLLFKRSLLSVHFKYFNELFEAFIRGYQRVAGKNRTNTVLKKVSEIERRGRYVSRELR